MSGLLEAVGGVSSITKPNEDGPISDPLLEAHRQWDKRWPAADLNLAGQTLMRAAQLMVARNEATIAKQGLSQTRFEALVLLYFSRAKSLPLARMGERLMAHQTSITYTVDRLEKDGYVKRVAHPADRRTTLAELTPAGQRAIEKAAQALIAEEFSLGALTKSEVRQLTAILSKLRASLEDV